MFDCLFLHSVTYTKGISYFPIMPMGLFSMADFLFKNNLKCKIINMGTEYSLNPNFCIEDYLQKNPVRFVAIDLHWYVHSYSAIELARRIKKNNKNIKIILGGFTASFFDKEIILNYPFIDFVIRGEGEVPLLELLKSNNKNLFNLPNLTFRENGKAVRSKKLIYTPEDIMNKLEFTNLPLMKHWSKYVNECANSPVISYANIPNPIKNIFYLSLGRGCGFVCSNCGGSQQSYEVINKRVKPYLRPIDKVLNDIINLKNYGIENIYIEFDPFISTEDYFVSLFKKIREKKIKVGVNFAVWHLPKKYFISEFAKTFDLKHSCLCLSPKSGSETVRAINKSNNYTNKELINTVKAMCNKNIFVSVHFKVGLPGETTKTFKETKLLFYKLKKFPLVLSVHLLHSDPASPMFMNPEKYKVKMLRKVFMDFYHTYRNWAFNRLPQHPIGYETQYFSEKELIKLKMQAYRLFYLRLNYLLNRSANKSNNVKHILKSFKIFISIFFGIPSILLKEEKP